MQQLTNCLKLKDIIEKVLIVKINKTCKQGMSKEDKYEATRGIWKVSQHKASLVQYVFSVCHGEIIEVYEPREWQNAGRTPYRTRTDLTAEDFKGRLEFIGDIAPEPVRRRYIGKSVAALYKKGEANPVKYINIP